MNNTNQTAAELFRAAWQNQKPGSPDWLQTYRSEALDRFAQSGFPTTRLEDWKYTDVAKLAAVYPQWLVNQPAVDTAAADNPLNIPNSVRISFVDGVFSPEKSAQDLPENILVGKLADLATSHPEIIEEHLGRLAKNSDSGFIALNSVFSETAIAIIITADIELQQPIYIDYFSATAEISVQPRLLVSLGANSKATVVEHFSAAEPAITNAVTEIHACPGSQLAYYRLQEDHAEAWHTGVQYITLERDAYLNSVNIDAGAGMARNEMRLCLAGSGASADAKGLLLADGSRHVDSRLTVEHAAPNTRSRERYRAILADNAKGVFNGRILVQQAAQKTLAELTNRNLLLNRGAEINTKPELEIYADDVKCAHGSTTGQLDETSMFYLQSRGISPQEARNILVTAFASELLTDIDIPAVVERTQEAMRTLQFGEI
jgi:Fe-S cluster assembly protein SufD